MRLAEPVEQLEAVRALFGDYGQGHFLARPQSAENLERNLL